MSPCRRGGAATHPPAQAMPRFVIPSEAPAGRRRGIWSTSRIARRKPKRIVWSSRRCSCHLVWLSGSTAEPDPSSALRASLGMTAGFGPFGENAACDRSEIALAAAVDCELRIANYQFPPSELRDAGLGRTQFIMRNSQWAGGWAGAIPTTNCQLQTANCKLPTANGQLKKIKVPLSRRRDRKVGRRCRWSCRRRYGSPGR